MSKKQVRQKHVPQRMCVVCRQKRDKRDLFRLVRTADEGVVVDPTGKRNGRGAYLCEQLACWDKILNSDLLNRILDTQVSEAEKVALAIHRPDRAEPASS